MLLEFLQRVVGSLMPDSSTENGDLQNSIKALIRRVHIVRTSTRQGASIALSDTLTEEMAALHVELKSDKRSASIGDRAAFKLTVQPVLEHIDKSFAEPRLLDNPIQFEDELYALNDYLASVGQRSRKHRKWIRNAAFVLSAAPLIGFGINWFIVNHYSVALLDSIDVLHPEQQFIKDDAGYLRANYDAMGDLITDFENYYFSTSRNLPIKHNPLPTVYDKNTASALDVLDGGAEPTNLFVFRAFLKNLKQANLVTKIGATAKRASASPFFWHHMDVSSELILSTSGSSIVINTSRTPVKEVSVKFSTVDLFDKKITPVDTDDSMQIITMATIDPAFATYSVIPQGTYTYFRFSKDALPTAAENLKGDVDSFWARQSDETLARLDCLDDTTLIGVHSTAELELFTRIDQLDTLSVTVDYTLLDGTKKSTEKSLTFEPGIVVSEKTSLTADEIQNCQPELGNIMAHLTAQDNAFFAGAMSFASILNPDLLVGKGVIAVEATLYLDMRNGVTISKSERVLSIIKSGDFAAINVVLVNYQSGIYDFQFLFNDEPVSSIQIDPLWPESLAYKSDDAALFTREIK